MPLWTNRYNGPGNGDDYANAVAVDGSNNVIVTGYSLATAANYDYATIKYSSAGVPLWTNRYNGPGNGDDDATRRGGGRQQQRDRDGVFDWQRQRLRLRDDQVFERGRAALDQPLQRAGERR